MEIYIKKEDCILKKEIPSLRRQKKAKFPKGHRREKIIQNKTEISETENFSVAITGFQEKSEICNSTRNFCMEKRKCWAMCQLNVYLFQEPALSYAAGRVPTSHAWTEG